jgi:DNA-binding NarL/FixJ family response regulator
MKKTKLVILIVDDSMSFVERVVSLLDEADNIGYINVARNYEEALKVFFEERPDVVLLDISLPEKSGIELLRSIRESGRNCEVIMVTNHTDKHYQQQCTELGANYFLDKSNDFELIPGIISKLNYD